MFKTLSNGLDLLYKAGAACAGLLLVTLCGLVLYSIVARAVGLYAGGATDVAGYVMATSTFLALAHTFRTDGHIRVSLLVSRIHGARRRGVEIGCLAVMSGLTGFLAYYMYVLAYDSYDFGERSEGADAILLWIPQTPVAVGAALLAISVFHTLVQAIVDYDAVDPQSREGAPEL